MKLNELFKKERLSWQNETLKRISIQKNLSQNGRKTVVVYGDKRIGKTTVILYLLGVNLGWTSKENGETIYDILCTRTNENNENADNNSKPLTSTAFEYYKADKDAFILNGNEYNVEKFKNELRKISESAETCSSLQIQKIGIPITAFEENSQNHIAFIDLPGVNTNADYVTNLYIKYIKEATVVFIADEINHIQGIANLSKRRDKKIIKPGWENNPKYRILITKAYHETTIIDDYEKISDKTFFEFYNDRITKKFKKLLPEAKVSDCPFAFDLGESLNKRKTKTYYEEFVHTNSEFRKKLLQEIENFSGDKLTATLEEEKQKLYSKIEKKKIETEKINNNELEKLNNAKEKFKDFIESCDEEIEEAVEELKRVLEEIKKTKDNELKNFEDERKKYKEEFENIYNETYHTFWIFGQGKSKCIDKINIILEKFRDKYYSQGEIPEYICNLLNEYNESDLKKEEFFKQKFYPLFDRYCEETRQLLEKECEKQFDKEKWEKKINQAEKDKKYFSEAKNRINYNKKRKDEEKEKINKEIESLNKRKREIENYTEIATQEYLKQKKDLYSRIKMSSSKNEKLRLFLLLIMINKDYRQLHKEQKSEK